MMEGIRSEGPVTKVNAGRLTNAIFVFTLLLLFKNVRTPTFGDYGIVTMDNFMQVQIADILSFLNAFVILAMLWVVLFHVFNQLQKVDRTYLYIHFTTLMMIIFIPISSHLNVVYPGKSDFPVLFNLNMLAIGLLLALEWWHISRTPAIRNPGINSFQMHCIGMKMLYIPVTAVFGVILSMFDLRYTQSVYLVTMLAFLLTSLYSRNREKIHGGETP